MRNYLTVLFRNLRRERLYAAINIAGLALGIACCVILGLFLKSEFTYDQHYPGNENIFRIVNEFSTGGSADTFSVTSQALGPMLADEYPDTVKAYVRFQSNSNNGGVAVRNGEKVFFWENSYFVDPNVFDVFKMKIIAGDPKTALADGGSIAVSESVAKRYFGNENPIGQMLTMDSGNSNKITLVFADQPLNTHLKYDLLFSNNLPYLRLSDNPTVRRRQLTGVSIFTYLEMSPSFRMADWKRINDEFVERNMADTLRSFNGTWRSWLQPLRDVHMDPQVLGYDKPKGNRAYLYGCAAVALIILVIACINYMNLATARATRRARSIGIRKILGASRGMLALQFMGEALLFALIALVLGTVIVEVVLKFTPINALMGQQVTFNLLQQPQLALWLLGLATAMGLVAGAYPAFYLSSWAPLTALTGNHLAGKGNLRMREFLVLLQFTISATAIACTLLMMAQMHYISTRPLGFEKQNRLVVTMRGATTIDKHDSIRDELLRNSSIHGVAIASVLPGQNAPINVSQIENEDGSMAPSQVDNFPIGENFEKVLGLQLVEGRDLSSRLLTDVGSNLLVNESLVKKMGWTNPIGKRIQVRGENGRVVGVVKDFNFKSLHTLVSPMVMYRLIMDTSQIAEMNKPFVQNYLLLDIAGSDLRQTMSFVEGVMANADPKHPFEYEFLDASLDKLYKSEVALTKLIGIFAAVSIFIACMGLFGLAAFTTEQRTREIGTRKVLGATSWQIVRLLARPVMILVAIASVLAAALSYFAVDEWLTSFAYHAGINWLFFVLTTVLAGAVAFITVSLQSWKTASSDPVHTLRFT